ncbi:hypothetical protein KEM52_003411, partial [Ascosphaera acerosa]
MDRDDSTENRGFTAKSNIKVLESRLSTVFQDYIFQEGNALIHKARSVKEWKEEHGL